MSARSEPVVKRGLAQDILSEPLLRHTIFDCDQRRSCRLSGPAAGLRTRFLRTVVCSVVEHAVFFLCPFFGICIKQISTEFFRQNPQLRS